MFEVKNVDDIFIEFVNDMDDMFDKIFFDVIIVDELIDEVYE